MGEHTDVQDILANVFGAAYYIAFGPHGPRALPPPGEGWKVAGYTALGVGISFVVFVIIRQFAGPAPSTMNKEYQEATNEYLKVCNKSSLCASRTCYSILSGINEG